MIRFRHLVTNEIVEYPVNGSQPKSVDIPPGYTHSIENTGTEDLLVLFWSNEIFDPARPDTYAMRVIP